MRRLRHEAGRAPAPALQDRRSPPEEEPGLSPAEPSGSGETFSIEREARVENVAAFRNFVEEACRRAGADESVCFEMKLVVDEACSNLVMHGYKGREPGPIGVTFLHNGDEIVVTITDRAPPFDPKDAPIPRLDVPAIERRPGGLGWHMIREIVDRMEYEANTRDGNRLTLVKRFKPA